MCTMHNHSKIIVTVTIIIYFTLDYSTCYK
eukprot:UN04945